MILIGIDTGGTFTDFVIQKEGKLETFKLPSNPESPAKTILEGIGPFLDEDFIMVHGTTVSTNAFLENKMGITSFLTSKGFEDILKIGRQNRLRLFSLDPSGQPSLVPKHLCEGISERTLYTGKTEVKPDPAEIELIKKRLKSQHVESVAIVFLHSYKNSENEVYVKNLLHKDFQVTISNDVHPEPREYERAVITVLNAALQPVMSGYMDELESGTGGKKIYITRSDGGLTSPGNVRKKPVYTLLSGPAGGIVASKTLAGKQAGEDLITLDMGGTSTDVSIIRNGYESISKNMKMRGLPVHIPMIDIKTIGAGGGSIAVVDSAGVMKVGPGSAGADPGPACYGRSGPATITDAFVVNGIIRPEYFLGGKMDIFPEKSVAAVGKLADRINMNIHKTSEGIIEIAASSITGALRSVTVEKGEDPRNFTLVPFGGAGGLIAGNVAERLGISKIIFPSIPGLFSAYGMLFSNLKNEFSHPVLNLAENIPARKLEKIFDELKQNSFEFFHEEMNSGREIDLTRLLELRYSGQENSLRIKFDKDYRKQFHSLHEKLFSYSLDDNRIEIENVIICASMKIYERRPVIKRPIQKKKSGPGNKEIFLNGRKSQAKFIDRRYLMPGEKIEPPAVICSDNSTILIDRNFAAWLDNYGNILMERKR